MKYSFIKLTLIGLVTFSSPSFSAQSSRDQLTQVYCPMCKQTAKSFLPGGSKFIRRNCFCVTCGSRERHRHLWLVLEKDFPELTSDTYNFLAWEDVNIDAKQPGIPKFNVLSWGGDRCVTRKLFARYNLNYISLDAWQSRWRPYTRPCDIIRSEFSDNSQDLIILDHILDKVEKDREALQEMKRILKPGGSILVMVPLYYNLEKTFEDSSVTSREGRFKLFDKANRLRKYGRDFPERLREAGFVVTEYLLKDISAQDRAYYGLDEYDEDVPLNASRGADIFICTKA